MRIAIYAIALAGLPWVSWARGISCPPPPAQANTTLSAKANAAAWSLNNATSSEVSARTAVVAQDLLEGMTSSNREYAGKTMLASYCSRLASAPIPDEEKLARWEKFSGTVAKFVESPEIAKSALPSPPPPAPQLPPPPSPPPAENHAQGAQSPPATPPPSENTHVPSVVATTDSLDQVATAIAAMPWGQIAFNVPTQMKRDDTAPIQLVLDAHKTIDQLEQSISGAGAIAGAHVRLSDQMGARLTGAHFQITANDPEIQAVGSADSVKWTWDVAPDASGQLTLHLTLSAFIDVDNNKTQTVVQTFDRQIDVQVTPRERFTDLISGHWEWLASTLLIPFCMWAWKFRQKLHFRRRN